MNVYIQNLRNIMLGIAVAIGLPAVADDFKDLAIYEEVSVEAEQSGGDPDVANEIADAIGSDADYKFNNATPEPEYDPGMSKLANKFAKKKSVKKTKKSSKKKLGKKGKSKKRTVARN